MESIAFTGDRDSLFVFLRKESIQLQAIICKILSQEDREAYCSSVAWADDLRTRIDKIDHLNSTVLNVLEFAMNDFNRRYKVRREELR